MNELLILSQSQKDFNVSVRTFISRKFSNCDFAGITCIGDSERINPSKVPVFITSAEHASGF